MGHSHYWTNLRPFTRDEWYEITERSMCLMKAMEQRGIIICDWQGSGSWEITGKAISFNGCMEDGDACETFCLERDKTGWTFCKTRYKPYDLAVCVTLLIAKDVAPDAISITSDGGDWKTSEDWVEARELYISMGAEPI